MPDDAVVREWLDKGTRRFAAAVDDLSDDDLAAPSLLSGWTRAHVIGHMARNADALVNLLTWARTGVETPMYSDADQRAADIEDSAQQSAPDLRADLLAAQGRFDTACADLPEYAWDEKVRTASRRVVPAREVLWMRVREVWIHAIDLDSGRTFADLPDALVDALLDDATGAMTPRAERYLHLVADDRTRSWSLGPSEPDPIVICGTASDLLCWLLGRNSDPPPRTRDNAPLPDLPRWL